MRARFWLDSGTCAFGLSRVPVGRHGSERRACTSIQRTGSRWNLHRTLVLGPIGQWIDGDELMDHRSSFRLGGRDIPRLDDTGTLLNVALHASLGWAQPLAAPARDTAQLDQKGSPDQHTTHVVGYGRHLAAALSLTEQTSWRHAADVAAGYWLQSGWRRLGETSEYSSPTGASIDGSAPPNNAMGDPWCRSRRRGTRLPSPSDRRFLRHRRTAGGESGSLPRLDRLLGWVRSSRSAGGRIHWSRLTR